VLPIGCAVLDTFTTIDLAAHVIEREKSPRAR
jgi:hypothetical protein